MDPNNGVLFGVCGLGAICAGLLFIGLLIVLRVTGGGLFSVVAVLLRNFLSRDRTPQTITLPRRRSDLRAKAQAADFDAALAQAQYDAQNAAQHGTPAPSTPPSLDPPAYDLDAPDVNRPRRRSFPDQDAFIDEEGML